ncbi:MAG: hypothetical protein OEY94_10115 [Alphaproteobacteria bacterium]|nr:hypothetical protein [Alphaproteobacteria bacterium]
MSEAYEKFARDTYNKVYDTINQSLKKVDGLPILVVSASDLLDYQKEVAWDYFTSDEHEEPALAGAYTHIAAIQAAVDLVGKDNVIVHFIGDQEQMNSNYKRIDRREREGRDATYPIDETIKFINQKGYKIQVDSEASPNSISDIDSDRLVNNYGKLANVVPAAPKIVVSIVPSVVLSFLQGYTQEDMIGNKGAELSRNAEKNPFEGVYKDSVFFNTARYTRVRFAEPETTWKSYAIKSENAFQVDAPGQMDKTDMNKISERIMNASNAVISNNIRKPQNQGVLGNENTSSGLAQNKVM